jgi:flagellar assembly factor FliW
MNLFSETVREAALEACTIHLPFGLIGLGEHRQFELVPVEDSQPFIAMRSLSGDHLNFLAVDACALVPGYRVDLSDEDAEMLQIGRSEDALIFNIVTVHSMTPPFVTVNLAGPVVVSCRTFIGKQIVLADSDHRAARYPLIDERESLSAS